MTIMFFGFDAYQKVIDSDVDVVLIAAASHFHPRFLKAAIDAGKHVFCEKPHALDVPGIKSVTETCEMAKKKGLTIVSGLCWRYDSAVRETMQRVQDGAIGDIIAIQEHYLTNPYSKRPREPEWSELEYQFRNWYHFNWLSGDQTAQQLIHSIDKASWALGDVPPVKAWGIGGRQVCTEPVYGDQFDHFGVTFEYASGVRVYAFCRDIPSCFNETTDIILGTKGQAIMPSKCRIVGENSWRAPTPKKIMYDNEHLALFDALRQGQTINNGNYMVTSSMLAILAQMVCYTGEEITWERAMSSNARLLAARVHLGCSTARQSPTRTDRIAHRCRASTSSCEVPCRRSQHRHRTIGICRERRTRWAARDEIIIQSRHGPRREAQVHEAARTGFVNEPTLCHQVWLPQLPLPTAKRMHRGLILRPSMARLTRACSASSPYLHPRNSLALTAFPFIPESRARRAPERRCDDRNRSDD